MKAFLFERRIEGAPAERCVILAEDRRDAIGDFLDRFPDPPAEPDPKSRLGFTCAEVPVFNGGAFALG